MAVRFDHAAIAAGDLAAAAAWARAALGVALPSGGRHPEMATHNLLTATGPDSFLEVIAPDPDGPPPGRARWFGLDDPAVGAALAAGPRPHAVVLRADDLDAALAAARGAEVDLGEPVHVSRGDLGWRFAVRPDGAVALGGAAPQLMAWPDGPHPAGRMRDLGLRYRSVEMRTPRAGALSRLLVALGAADAMTVTEAEETALVLEIETLGRGVVRLGGAADRTAGAA